MQQDQRRSETYAISAMATMLGASRRLLPHAIPPAPGIPTEASSATYGLITGACASPAKGDYYIVEFVGKREIRILAYMDRFARVFTVDRPITVPPAREPEVSFVRYDDESKRGEEHGCVWVQTENKPRFQAAQFTFKRARYTFFDSWFDFGDQGSGFFLDDALARAYLAFVYRPTLGGAEVPPSGIDFVEERLRESKPLESMRAIVSDVRDTDVDPFVRPPALARCLAGWLEEAGLGGLADAGVPDDGLRLVRTVKYADTFYLAAENEAPVSRHTVWALEAALNRFMLISAAFGDKASIATDTDCARWDAYLLETVAAQQRSAERISTAPLGRDGGEWETRCRLAAVLERFKMPVRVEARMRLSLADSVAAFDLTVPDASLMPAWRWFDSAEGAGGWVEVAGAEREAQARRYAMHFGLALAAAAFEASTSIQRVDIAAHPLEEEPDASKEEASDAGSTSQGGEFPVESLPAYYQVAFTRQAFDESSGFSAALKGDPASQFISCGALFDLPAADPFAFVAALPASARRKALPETADEPLPQEARFALGVDAARDLRIMSDADRRRIGERLADRVVCASSATEAIRIVREEQDAAEARNDELAASACTRLMAALVEGSLDTGDQNVIVACFLGEDRCLSALSRARSVAQTDPAEAVGILVDAIAESAALDGFVDGPATIYRYFDLYASRVQYELALKSAQEASSSEALPLEVENAAAEAVPTLAARAAADAGKRVLMVPDSFYLCHLEIVSMLEQSFDRIDDALRYGRRAIELAPATAAGYRQLGRAYMLVGDMENAAAVLDACLHVAVQPTDVAMAYYQLAYALWKAGRPRAGAACYLKSIMVSSVMAMQAMAELKELIEEHDLEPINRSEVDGELEEAGIVVAPTSEVLDVLDAGAVAAVEADLFPVAHNLLSLRLIYRPDDALVNVLRSLEE